MSRSSLPRDLSRLITEGGFREEKDLLSFALAVGVFNDRKGDPSVIPERVVVDSLSAYPLCALIIDDNKPGYLSIEEMARVLQEHLAGGLELMVERAKGRSETDALKEMVGMTPL